MKLNERLSEIQRDLKAPKGQYNSFGKFKYRSCEDIVEAIKPLLNGLTLVISDEIVLIGERYYVKATATISDGVDKISSTAFAREPQERKGMDESMLSGATSSYSRKYALNGLFAIDDNKDCDTDEFQREEPKGRQPVQKTEVKKEESKVEPKKEEPPARVRRPVATEEKKPEAKKDEVKTDTKTDNEDW